MKATGDPRDPPQSNPHMLKGTEKACGRYFTKLLFIEGKFRGVAFTSESIQAQNPKAPTSNSKTLNS